MGWLKTRVEQEAVCEPAPARVITLERRTLAQRLAEGRLQAGESLRLAGNVAQALRALHDRGRFHGALTPFTIELTGSGIELIPSRMRRGVPTPYTAPEVLRREAADSRADVFSFGAILFEMVTGRWPFEGDTPEALAEALQNAPIPQTGNAALDSVIDHCLAKEPAERWHIRRALLELKLASVVARQSEDLYRREQFDAYLRAEIRSAIEAYAADRLEHQQSAIVELRQMSAASSDRLSRAERTIHSAERHATEFAGSAAAQLHALEQTVRAQAAALESARAALAETDGLVERVVEAMDGVQSLILERTEFVQGAMAARHNVCEVRPISG